MGKWTGKAPTWLLWLLFLAIVFFGVAVPSAHLLLAEVLPGVPYGYLRLAIGITFAIWMVGRPLLVVAVDRRRPDTPRPPTVGVSVVIPCYNASDEIGTTVRSLLRQTHRPLEIVLVENNSTDRTRAVLAELARLHPEVTAHTVGMQPGVYAASVAINHGVAVAKHDVILRLDDDTHIREDAVARALAEMEAQGAVAVACNLRTANPHASVWARLQSVEYLFAMDIDRRAQAVFGSILCCSGGMALFRRQTILRGGGFVSHPREVSEDMDMTLKHHRQGHVAIAPEAIGFTEVPVSLTALVRQRFRWGVSGTVALYLHRRGLLNRSYWHTGAIGFIGLPIRAAIEMRDLLAPLFLLDLYLLIHHDGMGWLVALLAMRMALIWAQMACLRPALHREASLQGLSSWWLSPFFVLVYGPILLAARFAGSWAGVSHVRELRRQGDAVASHGLSSPELEAMRPGRGSWRRTAPDIA
jgi:cellulose synthase/poly-beta-1,6-N-acetylglucosamine synthase-like glycosyltransferase